MSILSSEILCYKSTSVSDSGSNGGRMSALQIVSGQLGGLFPNVSPAERAAGVTRYRKFFMKVASVGNLALTTPYFWQDQNTVGNDKVVWWPAGQRDVQSAITGSERKYGCGALQSTASGGATSCVVVVEDGSVVLFNNGDLIRITDKANLAGSGNEEYVTISGTPGISGNNVTITFTPALVNGYVGTTSRVASVYKATDIVGTFDNHTVTSTAGTYNFGANPVVLDSIGTVEETWTLLFTSSSAYTITGDTVGSVGAGNLSGATPTNTPFSRPYFTLAGAGFGGTYAIGDTIVFQTHPAALPVWAKQVIPASSATASSNFASFILTGNSA